MSVHTPMEAPTTYVAYQQVLINKNSIWSNANRTHLFLNLEWVLPLNNSRLWIHISSPCLQACERFNSGLIEREVGLDKEKNGKGEVRPWNCPKAHWDQLKTMSGQEEKVQRVTWMAKKSNSSKDYKLCKMIKWLWIGGMDGKLHDLP